MFLDVSQWKEVYQTCDVKFMRENFQVTHAHSPIPLPAKDKAIQIQERALHIYNNEAPSSGYTVSYHFPKNKDCIALLSLPGGTNQCYVSPTFGRIRGGKTIDRGKYFYLCTLMKHFNYNMSTFGMYC